MKGRCLNPKHKWYHHYGGRGITICEEWLDFIPFMKWALANGYSDCLTLERVDNNGNYTPLNCAWVTQQQQSLNKRHLPSKTGYVGVRFRKDCGKYQAEVTDHRKYYYVGMFDTVEEAATARKRFIIDNKLHGGD